MVRLAILLVVLEQRGDPQQTEMSEEMRQLNLAAFDAVWTTIRDTYWEKTPGGMNWDAIHAEFWPRMRQAETTQEGRAVMGEMLLRLREQHFAIRPPEVDGGPESGERPSAVSLGSGLPGFEVHVLDGRAVVTYVLPGSEAERAGVLPGWELASAAGYDVASLIATLAADPGGAKDPPAAAFQLERSLSAYLSADAGELWRFEFLAEGGLREIRYLTLAPLPTATPGNISPLDLWKAPRRIGPGGGIGYIPVNSGFGMTVVLDQFAQAVRTFANCQGLVLDLRGNVVDLDLIQIPDAPIWRENPPGTLYTNDATFVYSINVHSGSGPWGIELGVGLGIAGWISSQAGQSLGTVRTHSETLKLAINPRAEAFVGPVALLIDETSGPAAQMLARGLQELRRARLFGTRTRGATPPALSLPLPNGGRFEYAVVRYLTSGGQSLENGVLPDVEVSRTRSSILSGHDAALDAAVQWVQAGGKISDRNTGPSIRSRKGKR